MCASNGNGCCIKGGLGLKEIECETLHELFLYYQSRYKKGYQQRLSEHHQVILQELELRYRLSYLIVGFGSDLMDEIEKGNTINQKLLKQLLHTVIKKGIPPNLQEKKSMLGKLPKSCNNLYYDAWYKWDDSCKKLKDKNVDDRFLYFDIMDAAEAILRYLFVLRELCYISVHKTKKNVA